MINRLPWRKRWRTSTANNLDKINEIIDYINHSDISEVALSENGSGRSVQAGKASSLKDLTVFGESIQDGTPTPENPVSIQVVEADDGTFGIQIGDTVTPIDLQGNVLASLPDGTKDELKIDSAGHVWIEKNINRYVVTGTETVKYDDDVGTYYRAVIEIATSASDPITAAIEGTYSPICSAAPYSLGWSADTLHTYVGKSANGTVTTIVMFAAENSASDVLSAYTGAVYYYKLATPTTIDLGYIDPPSVENNDVIIVLATITPEINASWWSYEDITELITDMKAYIDYKTDDSNSALGLHSIQPINIRDNFQINETEDLEDIEDPEDESEE